MIKYGNKNMPKETCPYCGNKECYADFCDVEVGYRQVGPYHCDKCNSTEIGPYDESECTDEESKIGWYKERVSGKGNTHNGKLVDIETAKELYAMGLLDKK